MLRGVLIQMKIVSPNELFITKVYCCFREVVFHLEFSLFWVVFYLILVVPFC